jgi:Na+/proline symporter
VFFGLHARRLGGAAALASVLAGLAVGAWAFPWWFPAPGGSFLVSFGGALLVSAGLAVALSRRGAPFDFGRPARAVAPLPD